MIPNYRRPDFPAAAARGFFCGNILALAKWLTPALLLCFSPGLESAPADTEHLTVKTKAGLVLAEDATYSTHHGTDLEFVAQGKIIKHPASDLSLDLLKQLGLDMATIERKAAEVEKEQARVARSKAAQREAIVKQNQENARLQQERAKFNTSPAATPPATYIYRPPQVTDSLDYNNFNNNRLNNRSQDNFSRPARVVRPNRPATVQSTIIYTPKQPQIPQPTVNRAPNQPAAASGQRSPASVTSARTTQQQPPRPPPGKPSAFAPARSKPTPPTAPEATQLPTR